MVLGARRALNPANERLLRKLEKAQCIILAGIITPSYYIIQILMIKTCLPQYILSAYFITNIIGNMYLSIFTDTRVGYYDGDGEYCEICKQNRPPMSWHCRTCNACIKRSDHHCYFLSHCVGRNNYRYFVCLLGHLAIAMLYCSIWYFTQLSRMKLDIFKFKLPTKLANLMIVILSLCTEDFYVTCLFLDLILLCFAGGLFGFHARNVFRGTTTYESLHHKPIVKRHWKTNVMYVLGTRWYWAILWPFVSSPLPDYELLNSTE